MNPNGSLIATILALLTGLCSASLLCGQQSSVRTTGNETGDLSSLPRYFASPTNDQLKPSRDVDQRIGVAQKQVTSPVLEQSSAGAVAADGIGCCPEICESCRPRQKFCRIPGFNGHPYESKSVNGCRCGQHCQRRLYPNLNPHWPTPFANMQRYCPPDQPTQSRPRDQLDRLARIRISNYQRQDNGYSGRHCDGFGLLGESYYQVPENGQSARQGQPHRDQ